MERINNYNDNLVSPTRVFERNITRSLFERMLLDHLVVDIEYSYSPEILDDFWEPVKVGLKQEHLDEFDMVKIQPGTESFNCFICSNDNDTYKLIPCCNKEMCTLCVNRWFKESVKCPFCKQDIRELYEYIESTDSVESIESMDEVTFADNTVGNVVGFEEYLYGNYSHLMN